MINFFWNILQRQYRWLIIGVTTLIIVVTLISPSQSQQRTKIRVMIRSLEASQWQSIEAKFEQENSDLDLEIIKAPNDTNLVEDLYTSAFLLGDAPYDLVYLDIAWVAKFAAAGWLKDLDEFTSQEQLQQFLDGDIAGGKYQDKLYRFPFRSDAGMLYYRQDLLAENGYQPPNTFEELVAISQDLQQKNVAKWGYVWQGKQYEGLVAMFVEILQGFGSYWVNPQTLEVGLDSEKAIAATQFLQDTIKLGISPPGVTTYSEEETRRLFEAGESVFLRNWPYVAGLAAKSNLAGKFALKPMVHQPEFDSGACQGGWGLGIAATSQHPEAAWRVIEFTSREDIQREFVLETGYLPSLRSLFIDPEIVEKYDYYPQMQEILQNSTLRPPIPQYAQASDILQRYLSAAITNSMTAEQAMKAAAEETRSLLGK